jgi:hypothetical protein
LVKIKRKKGNTTMDDTAIFEIFKRKVELKRTLADPDHCEGIDVIMKQFEGVGFSTEDTIDFIARLNYLIDKGVPIHTA